MKARTRRGLAIAGGLAALGVASALVLNAFSGNLVFFFSPSQVAANEAPRERSFRVGGLVEEGSIRRQPGGLTVHFVVTDLAKTVPVVYTGLLPDLFVEGKGVVAQGRLGSDGVFRADQVLAKHDENYMAPEAAQALADARKAGVPAGPPLQGASEPAGPDRSVGSPHAARKPHLAPSPLPEGEGARQHGPTRHAVEEEEAPRQGSAPMSSEDGARRHGSAPVTSEDGARRHGSAPLPSGERLGEGLAQERHPKAWATSEGLR